MALLLRKKVNRLSTCNCLAFGNFTADVMPRWGWLALVPDRCRHHRYIPHIGKNVAYLRVALGKSESRTHSVPNSGETARKLLSFSCVSES